MNETMRNLAGQHAQRAALTFAYQISGYVPAEQRRLLTAQVQSIILYEIDRCLMTLANQKDERGATCIFCHGKSC